MVSMDLARKYLCSLALQGYDYETKLTFITVVHCRPPDEAAGIFHCPNGGHNSVTRSCPTASSASQF